MQVNYDQAFVDLVFKADKYELQIIWIKLQSIESKNFDSFKGL